MNYKLLVDTTELATIIKNIKNECGNVSATLKEIQTTLDEVPSAWEGTDSKSYVNSLQTYLSSLDQLSTFYNDMIKTMSSLRKQYEETDSELAQKVEGGLVVSDARMMTGTVENSLWVNDVKELKNYVSEYKETTKNKNGLIEMESSWEPLSKDAAVFEASPKSGKDNQLQSLISEYKDASKKGDFVNVESTWEPVSKDAAVFEVSSKSEKDNQFRSLISEYNASKNKK